MNNFSNSRQETVSTAEKLLAILLAVFIVFFTSFVVVLLVRSTAAEPADDPTVPPAQESDVPDVPDVPDPAPDDPGFVRDPNKKYVALTFDDGPHNVYTKEIVDALSQYGYHATFFVIGNRVDGGDYNGGEAMKYAAEAGNEIAIHGYTHSVYYDECDDATYRDELNYTKEAIQEILPNYEVKLMRPIGGSISASRVDSCEYAVIKWSVDSNDWRYKYDDDGAETIVENVMSQVEDGSIILMHDIYGNTCEATKIIIQQLHEEGYEIVTVSDLLGDSLQAGEVYYEYE